MGLGRFAHNLIHTKCAKVGGAAHRLELSATGAGRVPENAAGGG